MDSHGEHKSLWSATVEGVTFEPLRSDTEVDVAIVGAGITGLTAALRLKRAGKRVAVLERGHVASGSTGSTSAHLTTMFDVGYHTIEKTYDRDTVSAVARSMYEAIDEIEKLVHELNIDCGFARLNGYYYTEDDSGIEQVEKEFESCRRGGLPVTMLDQVPLPYPTSKGFSVERQARFHPIAYCNGLARAVHGDGCAVYTGTPVLELSDGEPGTIRTSEATVKARDIILATHTPLGINPLQTALSVERSYVIAVRMPAGVPDGLFWNTATPYEYTRPYHMPDGTPLLVVGGKDHAVGLGDPLQSLQSLVQFTRDRFSYDEVLYNWSTQYYGPADSLPFIGKSPFHSHLYVSTGYSGDGLTMGTLGGMIVGDAVLERGNQYARVYKPRRLNIGGISEFIQLGVHNAEMLIGGHLTQGKKPESLSPGESTVHRHHGALTAIHRDEDGKLHSRNAVCPHMKCVVHWNDGERTWDCPCHGSRYTIDGNIIEGPALSGLKEEQKTERPTEAPTHAP
ncbi:MAG: FAD-dependent oxidoreductase [Chitinivibrionales bacterium]|nr:FAD-dependent oxidoreductase [Chitinivibrionales bacterium]